MVPGGRWRTTPEVCTTHSLRASAAVACASGESSALVTIWVTPYRSRMSKNVRWPWSRRRWTQPASITRSPTCSSRSSPQVCVRNDCRVGMGSPILTERTRGSRARAPGDRSGPDGADDLVDGQLALVARVEVAQRHPISAPRRDDHRPARAALRRALQLPAQLALTTLRADPQTRGAQRGADPEPLGGGTRLGGDDRDEGR